MALVKERTNGKPVNVVARLASIPEKSVADKYISRQIGGQDDFALFDYAFKNDFNVLLEGDTGAGKTMAARAYAASRGKHFYSTPNNVGVEPSQLFGKLIPDETGLTLGVWQDGPVTDLARYGGVLLLNEVNFLPPRVATVIFSLLDDRREIVLLDHKGEVIRVHRPNCWCDLDAAECESRWLLVIADMNPDYLGTQKLNDAFRNRFGIQIQWDYDPQVESKLVKSKDLLDLVQKLRKGRKDGDLITPTSTNMMVEFERLQKALGLPFAVSNFIQHYDTEDRDAVQKTIQAIESNLVASYRRLEEAEKLVGKATGRVAVPKSDWELLEDEVDQWVGA